MMAPAPPPPDPPRLDVKPVPDDLELLLPLERLLEPDDPRLEE
jgi:hypothetical protein